MSTLYFCVLCVSNNFWIENDGQQQQKMFEVKRKRPVIWVKVVLYVISFINNLIKKFCHRFFISWGNVDFSMLVFYNLGATWMKIVIRTHDSWQIMSIEWWPGNQKFVDFLNISGVKPKWEVAVIGFEHTSPCLHSETTSKACIYFGFFFKLSIWLRSFMKRKQF